MENNGDQPAFPISVTEHVGFDAIGGKIFQSITVGGLSKREYFAAMALQGILGNPACNPETPTHFNTIVSDAVMFADLTLKKLDKPQ